MIVTKPEIKKTMEIFYELSQLPKVKLDAITIGNFDGVHLGHQAILRRLKDLSGKSNEKTLVVTFSNHPTEILRPSSAVKTLCTWRHKCRLFEEQGIDFLLALTFTPEFSQQTAQQFLSHLYHAIPFSHLVLGHDAALGRDRQGDCAAVNRLAEQYHFTAEYLPPLSVEGSPVSSTRIREQLRSGNLAGASKLLGREFSVYNPVIRGQGKGRTIGFPTANLEVSGLELPPEGVYAVKVKCFGQEMPAIANLGVAPTVRSDKALLLEVHFLDEELALYGEEVEVIFAGFIRPERQFVSMTELSEQIKRDIVNAKDILGIKTL